MPLGTAGGMDTTTAILTITPIHTNTPIRIPTTMGTATITAMQSPLLQRPQPLPVPVGAPCPSPWWPRGMCTAPTATTTTELTMGRPPRNPLPVRAEPVEAKAHSTRHLAPHPHPLA